MRLSNTAETYGLVHQVLHWSIAIMIIALMAMGKYMHGLPLGNAEAIDQKVWLYSLHKTMGVIALALIIARVAWAIIQPHPKAMHGGLQGFASKTVHWVLYGSMVLLPISGWLHHAATEGFAPIWWPLSQELPGVPNDAAIAKFFGNAHEILGFTLGGALFLHIAGALKHAFIDKDQVLARMVPGRYRETGVVPNMRVPAGPALAAGVGVMALSIGAIFATGILQDQSRASGLAALENTITNGSDATDTSSGLVWAIDYDASTLGIEIDQLGTAVPGSFAQWRADVIFDPDNLGEASIEAQIAIESLDLPELASQAISGEFLNASAHPVAIFTSDDVIAVDGGYEAKGTLSLAGLEKPFTLPFSFDDVDGTAKVRAEAVIQRLDFNVGIAYPDDSSVGRAVKIVIDIEATRATENRSAGISS